MLDVLAFLKQLGALDFAPRDASGFPAAGSPPKSLVGHIRIVKPDGSIELTGVCFDGSTVEGVIPAPAPAK